MKVVFIDLDGTLRSDTSLKYWKDKGQESTKLYPPAQAALEKLFKSNKALRLVLTGKDRVLDIKELKGILGFDSILVERFFDTTPSLRNGTRGEEIRKFIMHHSTRIKDYLVVDANEDLHPIDDSNVIQIDSITGLTENDILEAISRLR